MAQDWEEPDDQIGDGLDIGPTSQMYNPNLGTTQFNYAQGRIVVDDLHNTITINTSSYGTINSTLDQAALYLANQNTSTAALYRYQMSQSLRPDFGVVQRIRDLNHNGILDEIYNPLRDCNLTLECTPFRYLENNGIGFFTQYFDK